MIAVSTSVINGIICAIVTGISETKVMGAVVGEIMGEGIIKIPGLQS
jgi:hypothetical protein